MVYGYDDLDRLLGRTSNFGDVSFTYDGLERLSGFVSASGNSYSFSYNDLNRLIGVARPGSSTTISYTSAGLVEGLTHIANGTTKSFAAYSFDSRSLISQKRSPAGTEDYSYDLNGQVTGVSGAYPESFIYDALGNRVSDSSGVSLYEVTTERLKEDSQYHYTYDPAGNLIAKFPKDQNKKAYQYTYDSRNQMIGAKVLSTSLGQVEREITYRYDAFGRRLEKRIMDISGGTSVRRYVYENDNIIAELSGDNAVLAKYDHTGAAVDDVLAAEITPNGAALGLALSPGKYFFLKDALGSITDVANSTGEVLQRYEYTAFGTTRAIRDAAGNDISSAPIISTSYRFAGREWDAETGLSYNRARYYDPQIGRFMQRDPHPGRISTPMSVVNKYAYAHNNPLRFTDPTGLDIWDEIGKVVSVVVGAVVAIYAGAFIAAALGLSGIAGAIVGSLGGALAGGIVTAGGYALSHSNASEGFRIGASIGLIAGGFGGYFSTTIVQAGQYTIQPSQIFDFVKNQIKSAANFSGGPELVEASAKYSAVSSWPVWTKLAAYANAALPFVVGGAEIAAIGYADRCIQADTCSEILPKEIGTSDGWSW